MLKFQNLIFNFEIIFLEFLSVRNELSLAVYFLDSDDSDEQLRQFVNNFD